MQCLACSWTSVLSAAAVVQITACALLAEVQRALLLPADFHAHPPLDAQDCQSCCLSPCMRCSFCASNHSYLDFAWCTEKKGKLYFFSDFNRSLPRRQPGAMIIGHSPNARCKRLCACMMPPDRHLWWCAQFGKAIALTHGAQS